jgi:hypothetical protein
VLSLTLFLILLDPFLATLSSMSSIVIPLSEFLARLDDTNFQNRLSMLSILEKIALFGEERVCMN